MLVVISTYSNNRLCIINSKYNIAAGGIGYGYNLTYQVVKVARYAGFELNESSIF